MMQQMNGIAFWSSLVMSGCFGAKSRGIHNNLRLLYFGIALKELSIIMTVLKFSNSFSFVGKY